MIQSEFIDAFVSSRGKPMGCRASAGTGKTHLLTSLHKACVDAALCDPRDILAVTFSRNAAQELEDRISELHDLGLGFSLPIYTIHGFCRWILQQWGYLIKLPLEFSVSSSLEDKRFTRELIQSMLLAEPWEYRRVLLQGHSLVSFSDWVSTVILEGKRPWITKDMKMTDWMNAFLKTQIRLDELRGVLEFLHYLPDGSTQFEAAIALERDLISKTLRSWSNQPSPQAFKDLRTLIVKLPSPRGKLRQSPWADSFIEARDILKNLSDEVFEEQLFCDLQHQQETLDEFIVKVKKNLDWAKRTTGRAGFSDLERWACQILETQAAVRAELRERFKCVFLDECQDTNRLQWTIFQSFLGDNLQGLFCVGDRKQCLYQFRGAEPEVFDLMMNAIEKADGLVNSLSDHFRSRPSLLNAINTISHFQFGPVHAPALQPRTEGESRIALLETDRDEAETCAEICQQLHNTRGISFEKITILVRALSTRAKAFRDAFQKYDIPLIIESGADFFKHPAARFVRHLLNYRLTRDSLSEFHIHHSPLFRFEHHDIVEESSRTLLHHLLVEFPESRELAHLVHLYEQHSPSPCQSRDESFVRMLDEALGFHESYRTGGIYDGAVRLMTVHASKGLQADIVLVPQLKDPPSQVSSDKDPSQGTRYCLRGRLGNGKVAHSFASLLFKDHCHKEQLDENERIFYVAITRAKEQLIFVDCEPEKEAPLKSWRNILDDSGVVLEPYDDLETTHAEPEMKAAWDVGDKTSPSRKSLAPSRARWTMSKLSQLYSDESGIKSAKIARPMSLIDQFERMAKGTELHHKFETDQKAEEDFWKDILSKHSLPLTWEHSRKAREMPIRFMHDGFALEGKMDALWFEGSRFLVIDYKRTVPKLTPQSRHPYIAQLNLYGLGVARVFQAVEITCVCVGIEDQRVVSWQWSYEKMDQIWNEILHVLQQNVVPTRDRVLTSPSIT